MTDDFDGSTDDDSAPGWDAIDAALDQLYDGVEPMHWGTILPYRFGGEDPLNGVSVYINEHQQPHLHYVTYGFSDLYDKESDDPEWSGFGFELTFRLAGHTDDEPPVWVVNFLQNLARYVFESGNRLGPGHTMPLNSPICHGSDTLIRTITFIEDPQLGTIESANGKVQFLQVVGLTEDELDATQSWNALRFAQLLQVDNPLLVTDLDRVSSLQTLSFRQHVDRLTAQEGASAGVMQSDEFRIVKDPTTNRITLTIGAIVAQSLGKRLAGRIPFGREFRLSWDDSEIHFVPADHFGVRIQKDRTTIELNSDQARLIAANMRPVAGKWDFEDPPNFTLVVEPTEIKDDDGNVTDVLG